MKSEVSAIRLAQYRKVSYTECALIGVILVIATKFCTLPSILTGAAEAKAIWAAAILTAMEFLVAFFAIKTAKLGGIPTLDLPRGAHILLYLFFTLFFTIKISAFTREVSTYYALSLFENVPVLPVMILTLIASVLIARKGYMAIGRMLEMILWLFVFVFLFVVIFTRSEGDLFNAIAMFSPDVTGLGRAVAVGAAWYGDSAVLAFLDLRGEERLSSHAPILPPSPEKRKTKRKILFAAALFSFFTVLVFYAVFIAAYGDAAKMTDYAFIKLSAFKANTDELGSADWPVIILWSVVTTVYLTLLMIAAIECLYGLANKEREAKPSLLPSLLLGAAAITLSLLFLDEEGDYERFMSGIANIFGFLSMGVTIGIGVIALLRNKAKEENPDEK